MTADKLEEVAAGDADGMTRESGGRDIDQVLLVDVAMLVGFGLVMLYSASAVTAAEEFGDHLYLVRTQATKLAVGSAVLVGAMTVDYRWYRRLVYPILGGTIVLLALVLVPGIGTVQNGARRWIDLGVFNLQPAEIAKVVAVIFLAYSVAKKGEKMHDFTIGFIPHLVVVGGMVGLLIAQPDFGTSVILVTMMGVMLFVSGARLVYLSGFGILGLVGAYYAIVSSPYRMERIMAFLDPWKYRQDIGYQISESLIAIGSGGLTGSGLGAGTGKLGYVPELSNDFIATIVGEELGILGMVALVGLFVVFIWRGCRIALDARDRFGTYLAFGLTTLIGIQAAGNLCVVTGLVPTKGLTLPFFSLGGSSLVMALFAVGVLLNISRREPDWWERRREQREKRRRQQQWQKKRERILERREDLEA
jgi:cell division protein FtsW